MASQIERRPGGNRDPVSPRQSGRLLPLLGHVVGVLAAGGVLTVTFTVVLGAAMGLPWADPGWIEATKLGLAAAAGFGGAFALVVNYRKQRVLEEQHLQTQIAAVRDEFTAATQQLGGDAGATRLAGVYALVSHAERNPQRAQACIDVLCGHLRFPWPVPEESVTHSDNRAELEVRRTIVRLIGEHLRATEEELDRGPDADGPLPDGTYRKQGLASWSHLSFDFTHARLPLFDWTWRVLNGRVDFTGCTFAEPARFAWSTFTQHVYFDDATFEDVVEFSAGALKDAGFERCSFRREARFIATQFAGQAWFERASFLDETDFSSASFAQDCNFSYVEFKASVRFGHASFSVPGRPEAARFSHGRFHSRAWFKNCRFFGEAAFDDTEFHGSAFFDDVVTEQLANLTGATFAGELEFGERPPYADATPALLSFAGARIEQGLDLGGAAIRCASNWTKAQITGDLTLWFGPTGASFVLPPTVDGATLNGSALQPEDLGWRETPAG